MEKVEKKYALNNSYFKYKKLTDPNDIVEIICYWKKFGELPFDYHGNNWIYDAFCEKQKKNGVQLSQYMTPDKTAKQLVVLTDNFAPKGMKVLNACCGIGQLSNHLRERGFQVTGFDIDPNMVECCNLLYPESKFYQSDFKEYRLKEKWDLIVANPPFDSRELPLFMEWLSNTLTVDGKAILLLPVSYLEKSSPKTLLKILSRFTSQHHEIVTEATPYFTLKANIHILELSEVYKLEQINNIPKRKILMETQDLKEVQQISLNQIVVNPLNPRKKLKQEEIDELAQSIQSIGLLQPITLREIGCMRYEIVCGERRYRAFVQNEEKTIPAIVKVLTDNQVMEMALAENLIRRDLTPIEEANAFRYLFDTGRYMMTDLVTVFGKGETYIRSRLRLLQLTPEFQMLLCNDELTIATGLELAKFSLTIQSEIYQEHFDLEDSANWKHLGTKELAGCLERIYTMDLSKYSFDKTVCNTCPSNSATNSLFPDSTEGRCANSECLKILRTQHTVTYCEQHTNNDPLVAVCISPYDKMTEDVSNDLQEKGIEVKTVLTQDYPEVPVQPQSSSYKTLEEYEEALEEYKMEELSYYAELDDIGKNIKAGKFKKYIYIGDNNPKPCYAIVEDTDRTDSVSELQEQDQRNKDNTIKNICKEVLAVLSQKSLPTTDLSLFEDELFIYILLSSLTQKYFSIFGITDEKKTYLSDYDKECIIKGLTQSQRALLVREFIIKNLSGVNIFSSKNKMAFMIPEFAKRHFPTEITEIQQKYIHNYEKTSAKIKKKLEQVREEAETLTV